MKKYKSSGSSIFLMEIILSILLFSAMLCICLQFIMKAHTLTNKTTRLERAVTTCSNVASVFESGDGSFDALLLEFPHAVSYGDFLLIYLDDNFLPCEPEAMKYTVLVSYDEECSVSRLSKVNITCTCESEEIYTISAGNYHRRPLAAEGGSDNE